MIALRSSWGLMLASGHPVAALALGVASFLVTYALIRRRVG